MIFFKKLIAAILFLFALYIGIGGIGNVEYNSKLKVLDEAKKIEGDTIPQIYNGLQYKNFTELKKAQIADQQAKFLVIFPWIEALPDLVSLIISCSSFSLIGAYIIQSRREKIKKSSQSVYTLSFFIGGIMTGLLVIGITYILPLVLIRESDYSRPIPLMFLSLFAGMYSDKFYSKLSMYAEQIFDKS